MSYGVTPQLRAPLQKHGGVKYGRVVMIPREAGKKSLARKRSGHRHP